jgi:hypothetical protein
MSAERQRIEVLRQAVRTAIGSEPTILGNKLSFELRKAVPDFDAKREFGKLDTFVSQYCADLLTPSQQPGGHLLYLNKLIQGPSPETLPPSPSLTDDQSPPTAWQVFSNPSIGGLLYVDRNVPQLVVTHGEMELSDLIAKLSPDEHKAIARDFYARSLAEVKEKLRPAAEEGFEWGAWRRALGDEAHLFQEWMAFRTRRILVLFEERLNGMQLPPAAVKALSSQLSQSRRRRTEKQASTSQQQSSINQSEEPTVFRARVLAAINRMTNAELAQIWLPASVLFQDRG